jgi:hypothetical protein
MMDLLLRNYGTFQLETKLLRSFYSVDKSIAGHKIDKKQDDVRLSLAEMLSHRKSYQYRFISYCCTRFACLCFKKRCKKAIAKEKLHNDSVIRLKRELDIVSFVRDQRLSSFAHKLTMSGHQRWFISKFQKFNLSKEDDKAMEIIKRKEEKEALRTRPGYSYEAYASIAARAMNINTHEATDRRIVFELTGHKLGKDGEFVSDEEEGKNEKKVDPSTELFMRTEDITVKKERTGSDLDSVIR